MHRYSKKFEQQSGRTSKRTTRTWEKMMKTQTGNSEKRLMQKMRVSRVSQAKVVGEGRAEAEERNARLVEIKKKRVQRSRKNTSQRKPRMGRQATKKETKMRQPLKRRRLLRLKRLAKRATKRRLELQRLRPHPLRSLRERGGSRSE